MKKIIILLLLACAFGKAQANEWEYIGTDAGGNKVFIETDAMTENTDDDQIIQAWVLMNLKKPQKLKGQYARSYYVQYEYNCHEKSSRLIKGVAYTGLNIEGEDIGAVSESDDAYNIPKRNSADYKLIKWVCE